jgi:ribonuclease P protein component
VNPGAAREGTGGERGEAGPRELSLPRAARITGSDEIRALFRRGKRRRTRHLDVFVSPSPTLFPRLGLVVPKHKRTAVARNRLKRRLREIGRTELLPRLRRAGRPMDLLLRARPEAYDVGYTELRTQLTEVVGKLCSGDS